MLGIRLAWPDFFTAMSRLREFSIGIFLVVLMIALPVGGCESSNAGAGVRGDSLNQVLNDWSGVTLLEELWRVGSADGSEAHVLGEIAGVTFVGTGLAIGDLHSNRIHWYDSLGRHEGSAGGSGGAPGEFRAVRSLGVLPDGTLAALDAGGSVKLFNKEGELEASIRFPGRPVEMCVLDSTLVILGSVDDLEQPLHLLDLGDSTWSSIGTTAVPTGPDNSRRRSLLLVSLMGKLGCMADQIIYARSNDGTAIAFTKDGAVLWEVGIPSFIALVHENVGGAGIYNGPPAGATHTDWFAGVARIGNTLAVQMERTHLEHPARGPAPPPSSPPSKTNPLEVTLLTVFLDLASGDILGTSDSLPPIAAARDDRLAVPIFTPVPQVAVHSIDIDRAFTLQRQ